MLAETKIREVQALLAEKNLSQRAISKRTGVSRVVIHRIATGKRRIKKSRPVYDWEKERNSKEFKRCPRCGAKAQLPCLTCLIKDFLKQERPAKFRDSSSFHLDLELEPDHQKRYEKVRKWRQAQNDPNFSEIPDNWPFRRRPFKSKPENHS